MVMMTMSPEMNVPSAVMSPPSVISLVITGQSSLPPSASMCAISWAKAAGFCTSMQVTLSAPIA